MTVKIIPFNPAIHKAQFFEMNIKFVRWSHEQILAHHGVDMSEGTGDAREYMESMVDELAALKPPKGFVLVLEDEKKLAGMGLIKTIGEGIGEVKRMFIRPSYRGRGYGKELMQMLVTRAEELNYSTLRLETADFMPAALNIYRSAGFKERGEYPGGEVPEWYRPYCIFMEKVLTPDI
ncbi:MAG: GNAT family N-acetyltransferase [Candidatus Thorarchaeota archaeon]|jgi:ribosomal protein S18 acetylase RimI-like enzyme